MSSKRVWLILSILFFSIYLLSAQSSPYAEVTNIHVTGGTNKTVTVFRENNEELSLSEGDRLAEGETLIIHEEQNIELVIYRNDSPAAFVIVNENSDLAFRFKGDRLHLVSNYGLFRVVPTEDTEVVTELENIKVEGKGGDFGVIAELNEDSIHKGYAISFSNELTLSPLDDSTGDRISINKWEKGEYVGTELTAPQLFNRKELDYWQNLMSHKEEGLPEGPDLVMEMLDIFDKEKPKEKETGPITVEPDLTDDIVVTEESPVDESSDVTDLTTDLAAIDDLTTDTVPIEDASSDKKERDPAGAALKFFTSLLSHEIGIISYDRDLAFRVVSKPGVSLLKDRFEIGLYLPIAVIPSRVFTDDPFLKLNQSNNEWSFGSDQQGDAGKTTYDIFDDIFLKLRVLRVNHKDSPAFLYFGEYHNISDETKFNFFNFKSEIFYPVQRSTSFVTRFNLPFFKAWIYAEDILPKGIYGTDFHFMNPSQSFKVSGGLSAYFDCYELSQEIIAPANQERFIPAHLNGHFNFTVFDLPSYGFSMHFNGGAMLPLSYNFQSGQSQLNTLLAANPSALAATIAVNSGLQVRVKKFIFGGDLIVDSALNKVGMFDSLYSARRDFRNSQISSWMTKLAGRTIDISDFNFGSRVKVGFQFSKYVLFETSYQITFTYDPNNAALPLVYYDKLYLNLTLDSHDKWKRFNAGLTFQWYLESMVTSFQALGQQNYSGFLTNQVLYAGIFFQPYPGVKVNAKYGMFPDFTAGTSGWKMLFDLYLSFTPKIDLEKFKKLRESKRKEKEVIEETKDESDKEPLTEESDTEIEAEQ